MNLNKLTHNKLVDLWVSTQGDLTVPPHKRTGGNNKDLTKRCFVELLRRSPNCKKTLNGVKR